MNEYDQMAKCYDSVGWRVLPFPPIIPAVLASAMLLSRGREYLTVGCYIAYGAVRQTEVYV